MKIVFKDVEQFRVILIQNGFSQREFAKNINMSEAYLHQIIRQKKNPSPAIAKKIINLLDMEFQDIFIVQTGR